MPILRICGESGCTERVRTGRCRQHTKAETRRHNAVPQRAAHRTPEYRRLRAQVLADYRYSCYWCGERATECDFMLPLARGGQMIYENAVAACKSCNSSRGGKVRR